MREDWAEVELGDVCEKAKKVKRTEMPTDEEFIYLDIGGVDNYSNRIVGHKTYQWKSAPSRAQQIVKRGDILFSTVRTYLKNIAQVLNEEHDGQICSSGFTVIRAKPNVVLPNYLFRLSLFEGFLQPLNELQTGSSYPAVRDKDVFAQSIKLPPLPEQRAIVGKIEQLFSELDNGIANLKTAQQQLKVYRQAVLKKAFEGELTKEWRAKQKDLPTAEELLKQIQEEREAHYQQQLTEWKVAVKQWEKEGKKGKKPGKPRSLKEFTEIEPDVRKELKELPGTWSWNSWESILAHGDASFKRGPFGSSLKKAFFVSSGFKVYEQYCPINDDCSFERYYITEEKFNELRGFAVQANDFLISCSGVSLGRITQVPEDFKEGVINQALLRLRINFEVYDPAFFKHMFRSPFFQKQIFDNSMGTAIPNVKSVSELKAIPVPLLSKKEQHQIVQEIESRLSVCDKLEESIAQSLQKAEALRQSILKKAFEGRLLTDVELAACRKEKDWEPAEQLLKRIKA